VLDGIENARNVAHPAPIITLFPLATDNPMV
jgi:hypothetical protein